MKMIFVASDFSGLGKGTFAASLGRVLKSHGVDVRVMKCDLYYNYDAGTINPTEHGEVYVLADGTETDQDLGIYERYLNIECNSLDYVTSGRVHHQVFLNEREGKYLGQTVSVEHVIEEIKSRIRAFASQCEVGIVELGATIGDIKGTFFLEACRQLRAELNPTDTTFALLSHFPYLANVHELKTMGCQRSVNELRAKGLKPDIIVARVQGDVRLTDYQLKKIETFCEVPRAAVVELFDVKYQHEVPKLLRTRRVHSYISLRMQIPLGEDRLDEWYATFEKPSGLRVALVGKYPHADAYVSIIHQLRFFGVMDVTYMPSPTNLDKYDAVILPGGWGERGVDDIVSAAKICREQSIPCLGICLGLQIMVIEYARSVLELSKANSTEFDSKTPHPVVHLQETQKDVTAFGGSSRLGNWTTQLVPNSASARMVGHTDVVQRHRHRYEINGSYDFGALHVAGRDKGTGLIEIMELEHHPFYVGVQFHPEFTGGKSPFINGLVQAALRRRASRGGQPLVQHIKSGTPGTFLEAIDARDADALHRILTLSDGELQSEGIAPAQRDLLSGFLDVLAEKQEALSRIQAQVESHEFQMREIRLEPCRADSSRELTPGELQRLEELERSIEECNVKLRDQRDHFEGHLRRFDDAMRRSFDAENVRARDGR